MAEEKKKYWLKLERNFLNSSHIKVIKNMPNGKDYIIFYLAIMLESTNTEGHLRFNELVPYNEEMLASVTDTNVDIVRTAMKIFQSLGLISILQDGTIFLPDVPKRVGKESESAERVRLYRQRQGLLQCNADVTNCNDNKDKEKEEKKDKQEDKEESVKEESGTSPLSTHAQKHKYGNYKNVLLTEEEYQRLLAEPDGEAALEYFSEYRERKGYKCKNDNLSIRKWAFKAVKEERQREQRDQVQPQQPNKQKVKGSYSSQSQLNALFDSIEEVEV